jgi:4'-phosphopantetheinyl transferase
MENAELVERSRRDFLAGCDMTTWAAVGGVPRLENGYIHVWNASVTALAARRDDLRAALSSAERERAMRFQGTMDRERFVVAHGVLRLLLADYAAHPPEALHFEEGRHGKPRLVVPESSLSFNLSHSGDVVLVAVMIGARVGVDVEVMHGRSEEELNRVAKRVFAIPEQRALESAAATHTLQFYSTWSRKEAYIKATGEGIAGGLAHFHVYGEDGTSLDQVRDSSRDDRWWLTDLVPASNHAGAVATDLGDARLETYRVDSDLITTLLATRADTR